MIQKSKGPNGNAHRVITFLTREELDFLDRIGKDALFSAGSKLSRSKIISAIVSIVSKLNIDGCGLSSERELEGRIIKAIKDLSQGNFKTQSKSNKQTNNEERKGVDNGTVL